MLKMTMGSRGTLPAEEGMTAFSALHLLRNYNHLLTPPGGNLIPGYHQYPLGASSEVHNVHNAHRHNSPRYVGGFELSPMLGAFQPYSHLALPSPLVTEPKPSRSNVLMTPPLYSRRPRGEKKPIPDEQKDDRYYERRKRNNQAAKKSRDARKLREDQIALRATILEHENAILRAQILTLREETQSLRQLLLQKKDSHRVLPMITENEFTPEIVSEVQNSDKKNSTESKDTGSS